MWIPESAEHIERAAKAGELPETPAFDAKRELPGKGKTIDLAIDVAAMATDGGVLLYGVGEDDHRRPTIPRPFPLAGAVERIGNIVAGCIDPVPYTDPREYPTDADPTKGYIALIVPQSADAPHQVTVGGDFRFYRRGVQSNRKLTASDVERLHARRQRWEIDRLARLGEVTAHAPHKPEDGLAYLHGFCQPLPPDRALWTRATEDGRNALLDALTAAAKSIRVGQGGVPILSSPYGRWERHGADAWTLHSTREPKARTHGSCDLANDGRAQLFMGRAAEVRQSNFQPEMAPFVLMEGLIAGNLAAFLAIMGAFYRAAGYVGHVDLGLAITNVRGALASVRDLADLVLEDDAGYTAESYKRERRVMAAELDDAPGLAMDLLRAFFDATAGEHFNPFSE